MDLADSPANAARRRVTSLLRSSIARGDFAGGELPSDEDLAHGYDTSRAVGRDALTALAGTGLITRSRGVGTHEREVGAPVDLLAFHGVGGIPDMDVHPQLLTVETVPTPHAIAARLPAAGTQVLRLEFLTAPHDKPHGVATSHFTLPRAEALRDVSAGRNIYEMLDVAGLTVASGDFLLGAFGADQYTARRLRVPVGTSLLTLERTLFDGAGEAFGFTLIALRGDRFQLVSRERGR